MVIKSFTDNIYSLEIEVKFPENLAFTNFQKLNNDSGLFSVLL